MKLRLAPFVLLLAALAPVTARAERLATIIEDQRLHGFPTMVSAVERLQAAEDVPGPQANAEAQRRYLRAVGLYASRGQMQRMAVLADRVVRDLDRLADERSCAACRLDARLIGALRALTRRDFDDADRQVAHASAIARADDAESQQLLHQLRARIYYMRGSFPQAIAEVVPALDYAERNGELVNRVAMLNLLASVNASLGDFNRAEANARQAFQLSQAENFKFGMANALLGEGYTYLLAGKRDQQREALQSALAIGENDPSFAETNVIVLSNLADYWLSREDYTRALAYARRAESLSREYGDPRSLSYALANVGIAQFGLGDRARGIDTVKSSIAVAEKLGARNDVVGLTGELIALYEKVGNYRGALEQTKKVAALNREITQNERDKAVLELQEKYAASSRQREIDRLSAANRIKQAVMQAQRWRAWLAAALALVFGLSAALMVQWLKRARQDNRTLTGHVAALEVQSSVDPLTGAHNRRHADTLMSRLVLAGEPVAMALVDIDHFKTINDRFGHAAGDRVLVEVAARLKGLLRGQDSVVRWGGEEFALILPGMRAEDLPTLGSRVLKVLAGTPVDSGAGELWVTASLGTVVLDAAFQGRWQDALRLADLALYAAKAEGRNRAVSVTRVGQAVAADVGNVSFRHAAACGDLEYDITNGPDIEPEAHVRVA